LKCRSLRPCGPMHVCCMCRESPQSGGSRAVVHAKQSKDSAAAASDGHPSLSRWSSNADSVSLSDTLDTASHDKPTGKPATRYIGIFAQQD